jgi:hypothetical protein
MRREQRQGDGERSDAGYLRASHGLGAGADGGEPLSMSITP